MAQIKQFLRFFNFSRGTSLVVLGLWALPSHITNYTTWQSWLPEWVFSRNSLLFVGATLGIYGTYPFWSKLILGREIVWQRENFEALHTKIRELETQVEDLERRYTAPIVIQGNFPQRPGPPFQSQRYDQQDMILELGTKYGDLRIKMDSHNTVYKSLTAWLSQTNLFAELESASQPGLSGHITEAPPPPSDPTAMSGEVRLRDYDEDQSLTIGSGALSFETIWSKGSKQLIHLYDTAPSISGVALAKECTSISQVVDASSLKYTRVASIPLGGIAVLRNNNGFYAAIQIIEIKDYTRGDNVDEVRFRYEIQPNASGNLS